MRWASLADPAGLALVMRVRRHHLTYLDTNALLDLRQRVREAERAGRKGAIVEAGCALGGSSIVLAASKDRQRPLYLYDVFGMIPPPGERDGADVHQRYETIVAGASQGIAGQTYYGYEPDLLTRVRENFARLGYPMEANAVTPVVGLYGDTLHPPGPVALAHVDADWYESVKTCLERIWPVLTPGGVIVIDDYSAWSGCREAVDEFVAGEPGCRVERRARVHLVKA